MAASIDEVKGNVTLVSNGIVDMLGFTHALSPSLYRFPYERPNFVQAVAVHIFAPPDISYCVLSVPLPSVTGNSIAPLVYSVV